MHDGSIVKVNGDLFKKIRGRWVLLELNSTVWYSDLWMESRKYEVIVTAGPLEDVSPGTVVACEDGSAVAVSQGDGMWTITQEEDWFTTEEMLTDLGEGWKIIYRAGENNE